MSFYHDSTGIIDMGGDLLPEGKWFPFQITEAVEKVSKNGNNMLSLCCAVIDDPRWTKRIVYHNVVFLPAGERGDNMSVHFRKVIGRPYGGNDLIEGKNWIGCKFMGKVGIKTYNGKSNNEITAVSPYRQTPAADLVPATAATSSDPLDDIPF